ncbi:hypothetical protein [Angustibacter sp. Root456]|uniref:hypothetical protein n=1 Tax=Angustibacter sp. Root456 TaxID=1736539 RepID=UPI0006F9F222|nr:hypothetical protein [Angustibacter sp. Root456]KQX64468.1 hypothetical protein ASD06_09880 [Angustibacter sp. Root456]
MVTSVEAAFVTAVAALGVAAVNVVASLYQASRQRTNAAELERLRQQLEQNRFDRERAVRATEVLDRYRGPLLDAAWDLGHRVDILRNYRPSTGVGAGSLPDDVIRSTSFRLAQYLAWHEVLRRKVQFLQYSATSETRSTFDCLETVRRVLTSDEVDPRFHVSREEQRAIGECMITADGEGCIGYDEFTRVFDDRFAHWLRPFAQALASPEASSDRRLGMLQTALAALADRLDQERRYPPGWRARAPGITLPPAR